MQNITITLYDGDNNELGSTQTDENGTYEFSNLKNGEYYIVVDKASLPNGYEITAQNQDSNDSLDSDINPIDGKSDTITVQDGNITTLDGGAYKSETPTYTIGDFIWEDSNKNGVQDGGEDGLQNITITLYDGDNNKLGSTQTDENGTYEFSNLKNGEYYIVVDKASLPNGYEITAQNQDSNDSLDSDINPIDGKSDTITVQDWNYHEP